jgi:hypothetical protein
VVEQPSGWLSQPPYVRATGYWKKGFLPCASGVWSSVTIIDEIW